MSMPNEPSSGGNVFTRKLGPLPMWAWMGIALGVALAFHLYEKSKAGSSSSSGNASTDQSAATNNTPGGVDSSLVPQFINQEYVDTQPTPAPNVTVNNTVPSAPVTINNPVTVNGGPPAKTATGSSTISGSPGSYTTGLSGKYPDEWTSTGKYSLNVIAKSHGMTAQQLIAASESSQNNAALKSYVSKGNYNAMLPAGVELFFPAANWKTK